VICGEGAFDATSLSGKLTGVTLQRHGGWCPGRPARSAGDVGAGRRRGGAGGGDWSAEDVARRATLLVRRALRTARDV